MNLAEYEKLLREEISIARTDAEESHSTAAMNSFGAGYDNGYLQGLIWALEEFGNNK